MDVAGALSYSYKPSGFEPLASAGVAKRRAACFGSRELCLSVHLTLWRTSKVKSTTNHALQLRS